MKSMKCLVVNVNNDFGSYLLNFSFPMISGLTSHSEENAEGKKSHKQAAAKGSCSGGEKTDFNNRPKTHRLRRTACFTKLKLMPRVTKRWETTRDQPRLLLENVIHNPRPHKARHKNPCKKRDGESGLMFGR